MWVSRRQFAWVLASIAAGLAVLGVAALTPWPMLVVIVGAVGWCTITLVRYSPRNRSAREDTEGTE